MALQMDAMVHGESTGFYVAAAILAGVALMAGLLINVRTPIGGAPETQGVPAAQA